MMTDEVEEKAEQRQPAHVAEQVVDATAPGGKPSKPGTPKARLAFAACVLLLLIAAGAWYLHAQRYESTDNAQIDGHIYSISPRIAGTVEKVYVEDNQLVQAGQSLVDLDTRELVLAAQQSGAQYAQALAQLSTENPNIDITRDSNKSDIALAQSRVIDARAALEAAEHDRQSAVSKLDEMKATAHRDQLQEERYRRLYQKDESSRQEYESYLATAQASSARLAAAEAGLASAEKVVQQKTAQLSAQLAQSEEIVKNAPRQLAIREAAVDARHASINLARAEEEKAQLDLSFARIPAPISGVVTQRSAEPGNHVAQGEQMLMLVDIAHLWVTANFKETQLRNMHPGSRAIITVDALGRSFTGSIEGMPAITGSRASVLPPENATGNYVKVVQRLPVRIRLNPGQAQMNELRPGMSVEAKVYLQ